MRKYITKKIKVLFVTKETRGGNYIYAKQMANLDNSKFETKFIFLKKEKYSDKFNSPAIYFDTKYPEDSGFSAIKILLFFVNFYKLYLALLRQRADIIFAYDIYSFILISLMRPFLPSGSLFIYFVNNNMGAFVGSKRGRFYAKALDELMRFLIRVTDLIIVPSIDMATSFKRDYKPRSLEVVQYGVDLKRLKKFRLGKRRGDVFKILSVGRLVDQKDFKTIIEAFPLVLKKNKKAELLIVGEGEQKEELVELADSLGVLESVKFLGWISNLDEILGTSDLLLFSSVYEGFGLIILDAMIAGLAVVATDTPFGPGEILDGGKYGILVPVGNVNKMAGAVNLLMGNNKLRRNYAELGNKRAFDFSLARMLKGYEEVFVKHFYEKKKTFDIN